jgi:hypothetical protein
MGVGGFGVPMYGGAGFGAGGYGRSRSVSINRSRSSYVGGMAPVGFGLGGFR